MLEAGTTPSGLTFSRDHFGFLEPVGDGEGAAAEFFQGGSGHPQRFPQGDDGEAFLSAGGSPLSGEGVGSAPADPEDLRGFFDGEEVRQC